MKKLLYLTGIILLLTFSSCALQPLAWQPQVKPNATGVLTVNNLLTTSKWIDLKTFYGPEDIAIDKNGNLYTGVHYAPTDFNDGCILKITPKGIISQFCNTEAWVTGMHFDKEENLIACHSKKGLIKVHPNGTYEVLANKDENDHPILIPNDIAIASDGMIYFSNTSSKMPFSTKNARKIILEAKPDGGLYRYNPNNKQVTTLIDSSFFGNGVAVSQNDDFVLMVDLTKYRVLRHWLKGEKVGTTDVFIDNLPGLPNGISRRKDGSFWLGFTTRRNEALDKLQPKPRLKQLVFALPKWMQPKQEAYGLILHLSATGEILQSFHDPTGKVIPEAASIEEYNGFIYIGGDLVHRIGKFQLNDY